MVSQGQLSRSVGGLFGPAGGITRAGVEQCSMFEKQCSMYDVSFD